MVYSRWLQRSAAPADGYYGDDNFGNWYIKTLNNNTGTQIYQWQSDLPRPDQPLKSAYGDFYGDLYAFYDNSERQRNI